MIKSSVWQQDTKVAKVQVSNHRASEYSKEDLMEGKGPTATASTHFSAVWR